MEIDLYAQNIMQFYVRRDNQMVYYTAYNKEKPKISQVLQFYYSNSSLQTFSFLLFR